MAAVEAVILSGPHRGQIAELPDESVPEVTPEELEMLDRALDDVLAALDRLNDQMSLTIDAFKNVPQADSHKSNGVEAKAS